MILVDSCVWIDLLHKKTTTETELLHELAQQSLIAIADVVLLEILQGISSQQQFEKVKRELLTFEVVTIGGKENALTASEFARTLKSRGITASTIDTLIASWCNSNKVPLLTSDKVFKAFSAYLGLELVRRD